MNYYVVAVYEVQLNYGGPEEGGWWYQSGELSDEYKCEYFDTKEEAFAHRDSLQSTLDEECEENKIPLHSVLSRGRYCAEIRKNHHPEPFYPEERPYYE